MIKIRSIKGSSNLLLILFAVFALMAGMAFYSSQQQNTLAGLTTELPKLQSITLLPKPKTLTDNRFTDHLGNLFGKQQFNNKWSLVFFGFTNCPDICPTTLHTLKQIKQSVQNAGAWHNYQVVFMSVDPKRDTVERLSKYVPFFDESFIGITGDEQSTLEFTKNLGIIYAYHEINEAGNYNVDHSASILLINPNAELAGIISAPHNTDSIANDLIKLHQSDYSKRFSSGEISTEQTSNKEMPNKLTIREIEVSNAWVRSAPPGVTTLAAYMTIQNKSKSPITISEVSSPQFSMSMLHETIIENGTASMQHSNGINIEADEYMELKPQGKHIMLASPKEPLATGDKVDITLTTNLGNSISVVAEIRAE